MIHLITSIVLDISNKMEGSFLHTLSNVVNGAKALEEFTQTIVASAIEDVLLSISKDYGLNYSKLVEHYKEDIVDKHALFGTGKTQCKGLTHTKKRCNKRAVCKGYCRAHMDQRVERELNDRKGVSYAVTKKTKNDPISKILNDLDAQIIPVNEFMISKCEPRF